MDSANVRYIVKDTKAAVEFYTRQLGFHLVTHSAPGFAILSRDGLQLLLNEVGAGGAGQSMPDGSKPEPGGWNRIQIRMDDLRGSVSALRDAGVRFRGPIIEGRGGAQILAEDPSGNAIELFQPGQREQERDSGRRQESSVRPVPEGFHTVTPFLAIRDVRACVAFLRAAFSASEVYSVTSDDGIVRHAVVRIGDSPIMLSSAEDSYAAGPAAMHVYVEDVDGLYAHALGAGAKSLRAPADQFYGDRSAGVEDAWGTQWWLATHIEDVPPEELKIREKAFRERAVATQ